jgi:hypothetical protein
MLGTHLTTMTINAHRATFHPSEAAAHDAAEAWIARNALRGACSGPRIVERDPQLVGMLGALTARSTVGAVTLRRTYPDVDPHTPVRVLECRCLTYTPAGKPAEHVARFAFPLYDV